MTVARVSMTEAFHIAEPEPDPQQEPGCVVVCLADVDAQATQWLWERRVARGALNGLAAYGEAGKTTLACDMVGRETRGLPYPDGSQEQREPADVLLLMTEDSLTHTIHPRLQAAGADMRRVFAITGVKRVDDETGHSLFDLARDVRQLDRLLEDHPTCRLIVVDPLTAYLGRTDMHRDNEVRSVLGPLVEMAARRNIAILGLMHLSKAEGRRAIEKILGSVAFTNLCRSVHLLKSDRQEPGRVILACGKNNLAPRPPALAFRFATKPTTVGPYPALTWERDPVEVDVEELFNDVAAGTGRPPVVREAAITLLQEMLVNGPCLKADILREADRLQISPRTLDEAKQRLGVISRVMSWGGDPVKQSYWVYPGSLKRV